MVTALKVYLDNDLFATIGRGQGKPIELAAVDQLWRWHNSGLIVLGTSRQTPREMERVSSKDEADLKASVSGVAMAPRDHEVLDFHTSMDHLGGCITCPLITDLIGEPLYRELVAAGLKDGDARHLMYAARNDFDRF